MARMAGGHKPPSCPCHMTSAHPAPLYRPSDAASLPTPPALLRGRQGNDARIGERRAGGLNDGGTSSDHPARIQAQAGKEPVQRGEEGRMGIRAQASGPLPRQVTIPADGKEQRENGRVRCEASLRYQSQPMQTWCAERPEAKGTACGPPQRSHHIPSSGPRLDWCDGILSRESLTSGPRPSQPQSPPFGALLQLDYPPKCFVVGNLH